MPQQVFTYAVWCAEHNCKQDTKAMAKAIYVCDFVALHGTSDCLGWLTDFDRSNSNSNSNRTINKIRPCVTLQLCLWKNCVTPLFAYKTDQKQRQAVLVAFVVAIIIIAVVVPVIISNSCCYVHKSVTPSICVCFCVCMCLSSFLLHARLFAWTFPLPFI